MVELNEKNINSLIRYWRKKNKMSVSAGHSEDALIARCYVDAYQTVLVNHGLPMLPLPEPEVR